MAQADDHAGAPGPSPEELMEVMRLYKQSGGEMDPSKVPEDVRPFVEMFEQIELEQQKLRPEPGTKESLFDVMGQQHMKQRGHSGGIHGAGGTTQEIKPEPGFVVKCRDDNDRKIFVNMCGSSSVPAPGNWDKNKIPEEVAKKLEKAETTPDESLRFPLSLSDAAYDLDKQGKPCTTFDCIFNLDVLKQAMETKALKVFLIELALGWVQEKHHLILDPKYKVRVRVEAQKESQSSVDGTPGPRFDEKDDQELELTGFFFSAPATTASEDEVQGQVGADAEHQGRLGSQQAQDRGDQHAGEPSGGGHQRRLLPADGDQEEAHRAEQGEGGEKRGWDRGRGGQAGRDGAWGGPEGHRGIRGKALRGSGGDGGDGGDPGGGL